MPEPIALKYRAFISYSHTDTNWAKWLHAKLEGFRIDKDLVGRETATGRIPKTLRPIFRDRDDFTAGYTLSEQTLEALDASHALIIICSPASAKSHYVNEELRLFKSRHPDRRVIPLIIGGTPDDPKDECFSPALKFKVSPAGEIATMPDEPLGADVRDEGDGRHLALAKVVAGLLDVSSDEVFRRAVRERRRRQQRWIAGLSVVALALAGLAVWAEFNRREAVAQRAVAEGQQKIAEERRLEAERNFAVAKQGAESLVFDIASALRDQEGMRTETVRKILDTAEHVIDKLANKSPNNLELQGIRAAMLSQFATTYAAKGDTSKQEETARRGLAVAERLADTEPSNTRWQHQLATSYNDVGNLLVAQGKLEEAMKAYRNSLAIEQRLNSRDSGGLGLEVAMEDWVVKVVTTVEDKPGAKAGIQSGDVITAIDNQDVKGLTIEEVGKKMRGPVGVPVKLTVLRKGGAERLEVQVVRDVIGDPTKGAVAFLQLAIGDVLEAQGKLEEALAVFNNSLVILKQLAAYDSGNTGWQEQISDTLIRIGDVLEVQGKLEEALAADRENLAIREGLAAKDVDNVRWRRDVAASYERVGNVLGKQGKLADALAAYRNCLSIFKSLLAADSDNTLWQRDLTVVYNKIGDVLQGQGQLNEALDSYREGSTIAQALAAKDPKNARWRRAIAVSYERLGHVFTTQGKLEEALSVLRKSLTIFKTLVAEDSSNTDWQRELAIDQERIGNVLEAQGKLDEALAAHSESLTILQALVLKGSNTDWQNDLSDSYQNVGDVRLAQGKLAEALEAYQDSLTIRNHLTQTDPGNASWQLNLAAMHYQIAAVVAQEGKTAQALSEFRQAREITARLNKQFPNNAKLANSLTVIDAEIAKMERIETNQTDSARPQDTAQ